MIITFLTVLFLKSPELYTASGEAALHYIVKHFSVSPALGCTRVRSPVEAGQLPTCGAFATGSTAVWHHHPLVWPSDLLTEKCLCWESQSVGSGPVMLTGDAGESRRNPRSRWISCQSRGSKDAALPPHLDLRKVPL